MLGPEVTEGPDGDRLGGKNTELVDKLLTFDAVVVAGQAKSHCMAWTIDDLLEGEVAGARLAERTYLLEDCTSAVVVPGVVDYTDAADAAFARYAAAGMHVVRSTDPMETWPGRSRAPSPRRARLALCMARSTPGISSTSATVPATSIRNSCPTRRRPPATCGGSTTRRWSSRETGAG